MLLLFSRVFGYLNTLTLESNHQRTSMAPQRNSSNGMTLGIDFEVIVVSPARFFFNLASDPGATYSRRNMNYLMNAISRDLAARGIDGSGRVCDHDNYNKWCLRRTFETVVLSDAEAKYIKIFDEDEDEDEADEAPEVQSIKICSRKFFVHENWQAEVQQVLETIRGYEIMGCSIITNETTQFHVHIGFGDTRMPLRTAKSVVQLCTAFEDRLDEIHSSTQIDQIPDARLPADRMVNASLGWHFSKNGNMNDSNNFCHWLGIIEECSTFEELGRLFLNSAERGTSDDGSSGGTPGDKAGAMSEQGSQSVVNEVWYQDLLDGAHNGAHDDQESQDPERWEYLMDNQHEPTDPYLNGKWATVNVDNLYPERQGLAETQLNTLEFRQHAATLNPERVCAFVELMRCLVLFCHNACDEGFLQLCSKAGYPEFELGQFVDAIGLTTDTVSYYNQQLSMQRLISDELCLEQSKIALQACTDIEAVGLASYMHGVSRSKLSAVTAKIDAKRNAGHYADLSVRYLDVPSAYRKFVGWSADASSDPAEVPSLARAKVFRHLDGSGVE